MEAFKTEVVVQLDGAIIIAGTPFPAGRVVEVIVLSREEALDGGTRYPLRGTRVEYTSPFEPVEPDAWEAGL